MRQLILGALALVMLVSYQVQSQAISNIQVVQPADTTVTGDFFETGFPFTQQFYQVIDTLVDTAVWFVNISGVAELSSRQRLYIALSVDDTGAAPDIDTFLIRAPFRFGGTSYTNFSFDVLLDLQVGTSTVIDSLRIFFITGGSGEVRLTDLRIESRVLNAGL